MRLLALVVQVVVLVSLAFSLFHAARAIRLLSPSREELEFRRRCREIMLASLEQRSRFLAERVGRR